MQAVEFFCVLGYKLGSDIKCAWHKTAEKSYKLDRRTGVYMSSRDKVSVWRLCHAGIYSQAGVGNQQIHN